MPVYFYYNRELIRFPENEFPVFTAKNGIVLYEKLRCIASNILFFNEHYVLLKKAQEQFYPAMLLPDAATLKSDLTRLLTRNRIFNGAVIHLWFSLADEKTIFAMVEHLPEKYFPINEKGIRVDFFTGLAKPLEPYPPFRLSYPYLYFAAQEYCKKNDIADCLLFNTCGHLLESTVSAVFLVYKEQLFIPPPQTYRCEDVMNDIITSCATASGIPVSSQHTLTAMHIEQADELFLADTVNGIRWIVAYKEHRYFSKISKIIHQKLTDKIWQEYLS